MKILNRLRILTFRLNRILAIALALLLGIFVALYLIHIRGTFQATGVLLFDGDVAAYRRVSTDSYNVQRLDAWIAANKNSNNLRSYERLRAQLNSQAAFDAHFQPFLRVTKTDIRDLVAFKDEGINQIEGIAISFRAASAAEATDLVQVAARYLRDASMRNAIFYWLQVESTKAAVEIPRWDETIRTKTFQLEQLSRKLLGLQKIAAAYSDKTRGGQRDILSISEGTAKYLPISVQQLGVESEIIEVRRELANAQRELSINQFMRQFSSTGLTSVANQETGLRSFEAIEQQLQKTIDGSREPAISTSVIDAQERVRLQMDGFRQRFMIRPALARELPQVTDHASQAWQTGLLVTIGTLLLLLTFAAFPIFVRWILTPEERNGRPST